MRNSKKMLTALLAFALIAGAGGVATIGTQAILPTALAEEVAETIDVADLVSITEETDYRTAYKVTALKISFGEKNLLPKDGGAAYYVNDNAAKNGTDLMSYIYVNDVSMRSIVAENATSCTYTHSSIFPMTMGKVYAPICCYCNTTSLDIKIMQEYADFNSFSITLKSGFTWVNSDDETFTLSKDVTYDYESGSLNKKVERKEVSLDGIFSVRNTTVSTADSKIYTIDASTNFFTDNNWLMDHYTDLQDYIMVNGKSVADINKDTDDSAYEYTEFPGSLGNAFAVPVRVHFGSENGTTRVNVYIHNSYLAENPVESIGLKTGFSTKDDANVYKVTEDQIFYAHNGAYLPKCSVTFDGGEPVTAYIGAPIPADVIPTTPTKEETETITYTFDGWYNGEDKWDMTANVTGDLALTAKFTENARTYTVTYKKEDGSVYQTADVANGATLTLIDVPEKLGYTGAWKSDETYETMPTKDIEYTVEYTILTYTVTFMVDETTVATENYTVENKEITEPDVPEKDGFTGEWEAYELTTGDVTVKAVYTAIPDSSSETSDSSSESSESSESTSESSITSSESSSSKPSSESSSVTNSSNSTDASSEEDSEGFLDKITGCFSGVGSLTGGMIALGAAAGVLLKKKKEDDNE